MPAAEHGKTDLAHAPASERDQAPVADPGRVLVVHPSFLGDLVLSLPVFNALHNTFGAKCLTALIRSGQEDFIRTHPSVSEVLIYRPDDLHGGLGGLLRLTGELRRRQFDTALVFPGSIKTILAVWRAGVPRRIGMDPGTAFSHQLQNVKFPDQVRQLPHVRGILAFERAIRWGQIISPGFPALFTDLLRPSSLLPVAEQKLLWLTPLGVPTEGFEIPPWFKMRRPEEPGKFSSHRQQVVVLAPGATWETRRWPADRFAALAQSLAKAGVNVLVLGGQADKELCDSIAADASQAGVVSAAGSTSALDALTLIATSDVLVANDSAPVHMASATNIPAVVLFGPTIPEFGFGPVSQRSRVIERRDLTCRPCTVYGSPRCPLEHHACMREISVDEVLAAVMDVLRGRHGGS